MPITALTIRQFMKSRSLIVAMIISAFPMLLGIVTHFLTNTPTLRALRSFMANAVFLNLYGTLLIALATLVLTTAAFGDEIEDKTLQYLALKPYSRFRIVFEKFLAVLLVAIPVIGIGMGMTWAITAWGRFDDMQDMLVPMFAAALLSILSFGAVFLALSLFIHRALLVGVLYLTIWEGSLARFLPGIRSFSLSHYTRSLFVNLLDDRRIQLDNVASTTSCIVTIAIVTVVALALATWRLRTMAIE